MEQCCEMHLFMVTLCIKIIGSTMDNYNRTIKRLMKLSGSKTFLLRLL